MAALRFHQVAIDPRLTDQDIGNQLAGNAPGMMSHVMDSYRRLPASPERDIAIEIFAPIFRKAGRSPATYIPRSPAMPCATPAGVSLAFAADGCRVGDRTWLIVIMHLHSRRYPK